MPPHLPCCGSQTTPFDPSGITSVQDGVHMMPSGGVTPDFVGFRAAARVRIR